MLSFEFTPFKFLLFIVMFLLLLALASFFISVENLGYQFS